MSPSTIPAPRVTHRLGIKERNAIWSCFGPAWRAFYAWQTGVGWLYCTRHNPNWLETTARGRDVCAETITSARSYSDMSFEFRELARLDQPGYLFGPNGEAIPLPPNMLRIGGPR